MIPPVRREPVHPFVGAGFPLLLAGLTGWLWTGDWRWGATGVALLLVGAVAAVTRRS